MNHFNDFVDTLKVQSWMSEEFRDLLISKLNMAMSDAYDRGYAAYALTQAPPLPTLNELTRAQVTELKNILRGKITRNLPFNGSPVINAIKRARELTGASLRDSKFYIDRLQEIL